MSFGFRPEPIAIPVVPPSSSSEQLESMLPSLSSSENASAVPGSAGCSSSFAGSSGPSTAPTTSGGLDGVEQQLFGTSSDIQFGDLHVLHNIGHGSSGVVQKVLHVPSDSVLALKVIAVEADEAKRKQILLELKTLHESMHPSIVSFYGAFYREGAVHVCLEYMDASLLDISRSHGVGMPEPVLGALALPVLHGLVYMHREKHLIHRDIKPSNLLVDSCGNVKIADFGVSGELHETLAKCASWVGTVHYMSPERIQGNAYSYDSDVWSFGITLLELATAGFPYPHERQGKRLSFWDLLDAIVESPPPEAPAHFSREFHSFIGACLRKEPSQRTSSSDLLAHPLLAQHGGLDIAGWLCSALAKLPPRDEVEPGGAAMMGGAPGGGGGMDWLEPALGGTISHADRMEE